RDERVRLANPARLHQRLRAELMRALGEVVDGGQYIVGPEVTAFEREAARALDAEYAVGVASGTDALMLALSAGGVGAGDVVLTTPLSFVATVSAILRLGAVPRFCDVDAASFNLDPEQLDEEACQGVSAIV